MDLGLEFDRALLWESRGPDDVGVRLCDIISFRLHPRAGSCAYQLVMAPDRIACWIDFRERYFQLVDASANGCPPLDWKKSTRWNCAAGRSGSNVDNDANLAEI